MTLGEQEDFEDPAEQGVEVRTRLDTYLCERIRELLNFWEEKYWEECDEEEGETEPKATATQKEENVTVIFPAPDPM